MNKVSEKQGVLLRYSFESNLISKEEYNKALESLNSAYKIIGLALRREEEMSNINNNINNIKKQMFKDEAVFDSSKIGSDISFTAKWSDGLSQYDVLT